MSEHAALKAESKRLRRAAETGFFVMFGSVALLNPQLPEESGSVTLGLNNRAAADPSAVHPASPVRLQSAVAASGIAARQNVQQAKLHTTEASHHGQHKISQRTIGLHIPATYSGSQIREALDSFVWIGHANGGHCQNRASGLDGLASSPSEHAIAVERQGCAGTDSENALGRHPDGVVNGSAPSTSEAHALGQPPELEKRLTRIQEDVAEVSRQHRPSDVQTLYAVGNLGHVAASRMHMAAPWLQVMMAYRPGLKQKGTPRAQELGSNRCHKALHAKANDGIRARNCQQFHAVRPMIGSGRQLQDDISTLPQLMRRWTMHDPPGWQRAYGGDVHGNIIRSLTIAGETQLSVEDVMDSAK